MIVFWTTITTTVSTLALDILNILMPKWYYKMYRCCKGRLFVENYNHIHTESTDHKHVQSYVSVFLPKN